MADFEWCLTVVGLIFSGVEGSFGCKKDKSWADFSGVGGLADFKWWCDDMADFSGMEGSFGCEKGGVGLISVGVRGWADFEWWWRFGL